MKKKIKVGQVEYTIIYQEKIELIIMLRDTIIANSLLENDATIIHNYINELLELLKQYKLDLTYGYGYTSLLFMFEFLNDNSCKMVYKEMNKYIKKQILEIFNIPMPLIDNGKFNILFDYFKGLSGIFSYYIFFTSEKELNEKIYHYLIKCIKLTKFNFNNVNISIAHGLSSILLILSEYKIKNNRTSDEDIQIIKKLYIYILNELNHKCHKKNVLSVAWGNGELGMLYALLKVSKSYGFEVSLKNYEYILQQILNKTHLESLDKLNICYGGIGTKLILDKIKDIDVHYSYYINSFLNILKSYVPRVLYRDLNLNVRNFSIVDSQLAIEILKNKDDKYDKKYLMYFML
ncbi:MAG: lanthionine synthetase LanC family protein [Faecalibacillus intestinalis]|uniref:lanthionine synthetase LanC family protein n=1 Tax=Faecalibacillus intestinalis TaxID=1982626 RepID=UPI0039967BC2